MNPLAYLNNAHPAYVDTLVQQYHADPESVDPSWRMFLAGFDYARSSIPTATTSGDANHIEKEMRVLNLINGYRTRGHFFTRTNPVRKRRNYLPTLDLETFDLSDDDWQTEFQAGREIGLGPATLAKIVTHLQQTYCRSIGLEYVFVRKPDRVKWIQRKMESTQATPNYTREDKLHIFEKLNQAVSFENFLHSKYVGQKRFSLSGGETLIPALDALIERGGQLGVKEIELGMAHRGRLNVLANIMQKSYREILAEFEGGSFADGVYEGDVKYHNGFSSDYRTRSGQSIHLTLAPNPSHLEAVGPVVEGMARAKIDKRFGGDYNKILPVVIHGDAAIAGQGIVYEVIQMSLLPAYRTGGTIHIVINNQVGFTTNYLDGRSSTYCTDVAKVTLSPVFHVNADDVEAVNFAMETAVEYRQTFHTDVFIDLLGYRKYGHNESDEPRYTQPSLYEAIADHPDPRQIYSAKLREEKVIDDDYESASDASLRERLADGLKEAREKEIVPEISTLKDDWRDFRPPLDSDFLSSPVTGVDLDTLRTIGRNIFTIPPDIKVFPKIRRLYEQRLQKLESARDCDWAIVELLAYASLVNEGYPVRMSGQDCERGTFSHRHAILTLAEVSSVPHADKSYSPMKHVSKNQAKFEIYNSNLSEYGVVGFEYGYAMANPIGLVIWEAQFGDFANGAQTIFDQFMSSAAAKWKRQNGLTLYLPHGYEGQGPDHSSARAERFLNMCANNNIQVVNCTTPANLFHVLRRQVLRPFRIPLVLFTPKSLLRHPQCVSSLSDLGPGTRFQEVIDDPAVDPKKVQAVMFCWGKIYYELLDRRAAEQRDDVAIVRLEQVYPLPLQQLSDLIEKYRSKSKKQLRFIWVQEEPANMGPWPFLRRNFTLARTWPVMRKESANTATGFYKQHQIEQQAVIDAAFAKATEDLNPDDGFRK